MVHHQIKVIQAVASMLTEGGRGVNGDSISQATRKSLKVI